MSTRFDLDRHTPHASPEPSRHGSAGWAALFGTVAYWAWRRWRGRRTGTRQTPPPRESVVRGHQPPEDASVTGVAVAGALVFALLVVVFGGVAWLYDALESPGGAGEAVTGFASEFTAPVPEPRLQNDPAVDLRQQHARAMVRLHTYGWADAGRETVRIPIDRAMALVAERGLPVRPHTGSDTLHVPTGSGFSDVVRGVPAPTSPPVLGSSPEPYAPSPDVARMLGLLRRGEEAPH